MNKIQTIGATQARNNFFNLLKKSYLEKQTFMIERGDIPMVYIVPATIVDIDERDQFSVLRKAKKLRDSMPLTADSVSLLRKIRRYG